MTSVEGESWFQRGPFVTNVLICIWYNYGYMHHLNLHDYLEKYLLYVFTLIVYYCMLLVLNIFEIACLICKEVLLLHTDIYIN